MKISRVAKTLSAKGDLTRWCTAQRAKGKLPKGGLAAKKEKRGRAQGTSTAAKLFWLQVYLHLSCLECSYNVPLEMSICICESIFRRRLIIEL